MKVLIIANYVTLPTEEGNCRFMYIANLLSDNGNEVELVTSDFCHTRKKKRSPIDNTKFKITLIHEPGYKKNVSFQRLYSHKRLSKNIAKYLKTIEKPDVVYCAIPSLDVAFEALKYARKNKIKFIIDIQDLWPEAFKMALNIPIISDIIFYPMMRKANYIYSQANEIVGVSETYVDRGLRVNSFVKKGLSVYLGTNIDYFDKCANENRINYEDNIIRIAYIGTLGISYDIKSVIDAIKILNDKGINNLKFIIMGDGPLKNEFERYAKEKGIDCDFTGRIEYSKMVGMLCSCDIAVNPITSKSVSSIINKVGDYAASGLPVINTQNSNEYRELIEKYSAGYNCQNGDAEDISNKIFSLIENKQKRIKYGEGNRKLAKDKFDRKETYKKIIKLIEGRRKW